MKPSELREKTYEELQRLLVEQKHALFSLHLKQASGETVTPHLFRNARRDIARIRTTINQFKKAIVSSGSDELAAKNALHESKWDAGAIVRQSMLEKIKQATGADDVLVRESLTARNGSVDLAIDAIRISKIVPPGKDGDAKAIFKSFRRMRRDGFQLCGRYRQAAEKLVVDATGAEPKLIRMALADCSYNLKKAESIITGAKKVAAESGVTPYGGLEALESASWKERLAIARLKARANKVRRKELKESQRK
jgi:large subunit ribosomal protein L29